GAVPGRRGAELVLGAVAETDDVPRQTGGADRLLDPRDEALRQGDRPAVELRREDALQGRAHGGEGERVSRERPADAADVGILHADAGRGAPGEIPAHAVR